MALFNLRSSNLGFHKKGIGGVPFKSDLAFDWLSRNIGSLTLQDKVAGNDAAVVGGVVAESSQATLNFDALTGIGIRDFKGDAIPMKSTNDILIDDGYISKLELTDDGIFYLNGHLYNSKGGEIVNHQGLAWNNITDTYCRIGTIANLPISVSAGNANLPIHSQMKRCLLSDNGTVNYYLHPSNYPATKLDGSAADTTTGSDGQVMVEIPKFYYRQEYSTKNRYWSISEEQLEGYTIHPDFIKDGVEVGFAYYSAYEGSMWRASTGQMTAKEDITTSLYQAGDKMCSLAGQWIKTNEQRSEYRTMSTERGTGWRQLTYFIYSAAQLLYLIEYADFNAQTTIGAGRTALSGGTWTADSYIGKTGYSDVNGNASGNVSIGGSAGYLTDYMSYRGIENFYGNVWKMLDGLTIDGTWTGAAAAMPMYATNDASKFSDADDMGVTKLCDASYIGGSAGYIADIENAVGFIPKSVGASSTTKVCDYYYQYSEVGRNYWRVPVVGGIATYGGLAGVFALAADNASSYDALYLGGRLCF